MGKNPAENKKSWRPSIEAPLTFSFVMALIAGIVAMISATGGSDNPLRFDVGLVAFGVAFVACLLVISVMTMAGKDNPEGPLGALDRESTVPPRTRIKTPASNQEFYGKATAVQPRWLSVSRLVLVVPGQGGGISRNVLLVVRCAPTVTGSLRG